MKNKVDWELVGTIFGILFMIILVGLSIWYAVWQYNLCYPEISDSIWYCLKHAT